MGTIVVLAVVLFIGTSTVGLLPQFLSCKSKYQDMVSIYGAGLLIGAALGIVVPEGV